MSTSSEKEYAALCAQLNLDERTRSRAQQYLQRLQKMTDADGGKVSRSWIACALYAASLDEGTEADSAPAAGFSLSQLLRVTAIRLVDFFVGMSKFAVDLDLGSHVRDHLHAIKQRFVVTKILYKKYEILASDFLADPPSDGSPIASPKVRQNSQHSSAFRLGWLLYLYAQENMQGIGDDLVSRYDLLLATVELLVRHIPEEKRAEGVPGWPENVLSELAKSQSMDERILKDTSSKLYDFLEEQCRDGKLKANLTSRRRAASRPGEEVLPGLLNEHAIVNERELTNSYDLTYLLKSRIDERLFLDNDFRVSTPQSLDVMETRTPSKYQAKQGLQPAFASSAMPSPSGFRSPTTSGSAKPRASSLSPQPPATPMTRAMETVRWLRKTLASAPTAPSDELREILDASHPDAARRCEQRAIEFLPAAHAEEHTVEALRHRQCLQLYYRALHALLASEQRRRGTAGWKSLVGNEVFHRSILACSMEVINFAFSMVQHTFPYVLQYFSLDAFDFFKVIEMFVRNEPTMPPAVKKHLCTVEESVIEKYCWTGQSKLWEILPEYRALGRVYDTCRLSAAPSVQAAAAGDAAVVEALKRPELRSAALLHRKLLFVISVRIQDFGVRLKRDRTILSKVWETVLVALDSAPELARNRHVDQLVMAAFFGVCAIVGRRVMFGEIIDAYKRQSQASQDVYRRIPLDEGDSVGDIIAFYNKVFVPRLKSHLFSYRPAQGSSAPSSRPAAADSSIPPQRAPASGSVPPMPSEAPGSPKQYGERVYVSPLRSRSRVFMTPRTKSLYAFGESHAETLGHINSALQNSPSASSAAQRLRFDDEMEAADAEAEAPPATRGNERRARSRSTDSTSRKTRRTAE